MSTRFDDRILWKIRVAATLATTLPVRVTVTDRRRTILEVRRPPLPECEGHPVVPPCWFRSVVARACSDGDAGLASLIGSAVDDDDVGVTVDLQHCGTELPGDIWRLDHPGSSFYVFATSLGPEEARSAIGEPDLELGVLGNADTGVSLVSVFAPGPGPQHRETVHTILGRCAASELEADLVRPGRW